MATAEKSALRKKVLQRVSLVSPSSIADQSDNVCQQILTSDFYRKSESISIYLSMPSEIDTRKIIEHALNPASGKRCYVPRVFAKGDPHEVTNEGVIRMLRVFSLQELDSFRKDNKYKIVEPPDEPGREEALGTRKLDLILAPGVAFDRHCGRLGHGKGYYDKYISQAIAVLGHRPMVVGLALREQVLEEPIPMTECDQRVDCVMLPLK